MTQPTRQTLQDVARAAGLSPAATSYALRGQPGVSHETAERVRRLAQKMGYRPDLRVSSLMAHIRRNRLPRSRETLAFVWVSTYRGRVLPAYHRHYLRTIHAGAKARAHELGCSLAEFSLDDPGMTPVRLAGVLRARGVTGVVFSPAMHDLAVRLDWPWEEFSCAIIGNTDWSPVLHRAGHHHYRSMWLTLQRLRQEGIERPATFLCRSIHERIHGVHFAAFQVNHPLPEQAAEFVQFGRPDNFQGLRSWPRRLAPDALIIGWPVDRLATEQLRSFAPQAHRVVTLDWQSIGALPGMDVCNDAIAANAVDLVVAQLHRNERGVPTHPTSLLLDGKWREEPGDASVSAKRATTTAPSHSTS